MTPPPSYPPRTLSDQLRLLSGACHCAQCSFKREVADYIDALKATIVALRMTATLDDSAKERIFHLLSR